MFDKIKNSKGLHILVVDDNAFNHAILKSILKKIGHNVVNVVTGREALEALKRDDFDLILMDIQMPKMDGKTATSKIRKIPGPKSETPIIACTADTSEQHIAEYKKLGMNGLLKKPIDNIELSHILIDFLNGELSFPPETSICQGQSKIRPCGRRKSLPVWLSLNDLIKGPIGPFMRLSFSSYFCLALL